MVKECFSRKTRCLRRFLVHFLLPPAGSLQRLCPLEASGWNSLRQPQLFLHYLMRHLEKKHFFQQGMSHIISSFWSTKHVREELKDFKKKEDMVGVFFTFPGMWMSCPSYKMRCQQTPWKRWKSCWARRAWLSWKSCVSEWWTFCWKGFWKDSRLCFTEQNRSSRAKNKFLGSCRS